MSQQQAYQTPRATFQHALQDVLLTLNACGLVSFLVVAEEQAACSGGSSRTDTDGGNVFSNAFSKLASGLADLLPGSSSSSSSSGDGSSSSSRYSMRETWSCSVMHPVVFSV